MKANLNNIRVIKWYQYDAEDLQNKIMESKRQLRARDDDEESSSEVYEQVEEATEPVTEVASESSEPSLDDEVARIMAAFTSAKQDGVDSVFAALNNTPEQSEEDLISSICAPRQNNVDALVASAR